MLVPSADLTTTSSAVSRTISPRTGVCGAAGTDSDGAWAGNRIMATMHSHNRYLLRENRPDGRLSARFADMVEVMEEERGRKSQGRGRKPRPCGPAYLPLLSLFSSFLSSFAKATVDIVPKVRNAANAINPLNRFMETSLRYDEK